MIFASKVGLMKTVRDWELKNKIKGGFSSADFFPETYKLDTTKEELSLDESNFMRLKNEGIWIHKPTNANCGRGIRMVDDLKKLKEDFMKGKTINSLKSKGAVEPQGPSFMKQSIVQR
jgi:hypothetical protein